LVTASLPWPLHHFLSPFLLFLSNAGIFFSSLFIAS
jgi:hypothetical protein